MATRRPELRQRDETSFAREDGILTEVECVEKEDLLREKVVGNQCDKKHSY